MPVVPAATVHATLLGLAAAGLDADALAGAAGLAPGPPADPFAVAPDGALARLWGAAYAASPRPHLAALVGTAVPFGAFGLTDYLVGSAPTLGAGLDVLAGYFRLVSPAARLDVTSGWVRIVNSPPGPSDAVSDAFTLAVLAARFRTRFPAGAPREVHLVGWAGAPAAPFEDVFGAPVRLGQAVSGLGFPPAAAEAPLAMGDPALHATLRGLAGRADVLGYAARPVAYAVRLRLPDALRGGTAGAAEMAAALNLSLRTFQRRLAAEGDRYEALVDAYRREAAVRMLAAGETVEGTAAALGYAEPTSFTRAFRTWTGVPPSRWAAGLRDTPRTG